jgi:hypothetical protein
MWSMLSGMEGKNMSNEERALFLRLVEALEGIRGELQILNKEGIVVFGGTTTEEN